jgi:hypothetical protein
MFVGCIEAGLVAVLFGLFLFFTFFGNTDINGGDGVTTFLFYLFIYLLEWRDCSSLGEC